MTLDPGPPNARFEFDALGEANNYRRALIREFTPFLEGHVLEVGAGIGQMTSVIAALPGVRRMLSIEPDGGFCREFKRLHPAAPIVQGTVQSIGPEANGWNAIVSINVLEHIEKDAEELRAYAQLLRARQGVLCLFVPARQEIYAPLDADFGHYRRYAKPQLRNLLESAGFEIVRLYYFNWIGYFGWWASFCLLRQRAFKIGSVRLFDRWIFPVNYFLESRLIHPPFGQSLLAMARSVTR